MSSEMMVGMKDLSSYANLNCSEGEERIHEVLANEGIMDGKALVTDVRVPGRVLGHQEVSKELGADPYIVRLVEDGYLLEFDELPPPSFTRNNKSALEREDFVLQAKRWSSFVFCFFRLGEESRQELEWRYSNIKEVAKFPMNGKLSSVHESFRAETASDGSAVGFFVYELDEKTKLASRAYTEEELAFQAAWTDGLYLNRRF